jgi:hypothetical protein
MKVLKALLEVPEINPSVMSNSPLRIALSLVSLLLLREDEGTKERAGKGKR